MGRPSVIGREQRASVREDSGTAAVNRDCNEALAGEHVYVEVLQRCLAGGGPERVVLWTEPHCRGTCGVWRLSAISESVN